MSDNIRCCFERCEKKYRLTRSQQGFIIDGMRDYMQPDEFGRYTICNIYYDTDDWQLIRTSIEKPVYKEKLRVRSYGIPDDDGKVFVELKKKYDGIVYKRRIITDPETARQLLDGGISGDNFGQIGREIEWFRSFYKTQPKLFVGYDRLAFAGVQQPDLRITFDTDLRWRSDRLDLRQGDCGRLFLPHDEVIMELKAPGACPMWLGRLLSEAEAFPVSFSKIGYCYKNNIANLKKGDFNCA